MTEQPCLGLGRSLGVAARPYGAVPNMAALALAPTSAQRPTVEGATSNESENESENESDEGLVGSASGDARHVGHASVLATRVRPRDQPPCHEGWNRAKRRNHEQLPLYVRVS